MQKFKSFHLVVSTSFFVEKMTPAPRRPDKPTFRWHSVPKESGLTNLRVIWEVRREGFPGSHFFAKYKLVGETISLETDPEKETNEIEIRALESDRTYVVSIVAVDGEYISESDSQTVDVYNEGPVIQAQENVATAGWFIGKSLVSLLFCPLKITRATSNIVNDFVGMMLAIAFLLFILIIVCVVKRNRGGKYAVHERELAAGRADYPEEGFHEYSQPLDGKSGGGRTSMASSSHHDGKHPESDTDSMVEFVEGDTGMSDSVFLAC